MSTTKDRSKLLQREHQPQPKRQEKPAPDMTAYEPPGVAKTQWVIWYPDRYRNDGVPAMVTHTHCDQEGRVQTLDLVAFTGDTIAPHTGVRHVDFPNGELIDNAGEGCWEHSDTTLQMMEAIEGLTAKVDALEGALKRMAETIARRSKKEDAKAESQPEATA